MIKKSVGTQLREGREAKHLTLDDLENLTGIKSSYLLSMEMDQFSLLPSKSYEISYIKKYAEVVNLDQEELLRDYHISVAEKQEHATSHRRKAGESTTGKHEVAYSRSKGDRQCTSHRRVKKSNRSTRTKWILLIAFILLTALLGLLITCYWNRYSSEMTNETANTSQVSSTSESSTTTSTSEQLPSITETPSVDGVNLNVQLSNISTPIDVVLTLTEPASETWFSVSHSDYESGSFLNQELQTTQVTLFEDATEVLITLGNTTGVVISVNGQELDLSTLSTGVSGYITLTIE